MAGKKKAKESKELKQAKEKIAELTETLQRLQAEFENFRKQKDKEMSERMSYAEAGLISELLLLVDGLELALQNMKNHKEFAEGVAMIHKQLMQLLEKKGLRQIECEGCTFDPHRHEVMLSVEDDGDEDMVLAELQKGYMLKDRVLRHSKVKVSKKKT